MEQLQNNNRYVEYYKDHDIFEQVSLGAFAMYVDLVFNLYDKLSEIQKIDFIIQW